MAMAVRRERIPDIRTKRPKTPRYVVELLRRMCDPRPENRFSTPDEVVQFIENWRLIEEQRFRTFLVWTLSVTAVVLAAVITLGVWWIQMERKRPLENTTAPTQETAPESEFSIPEGIE